MASEMSQSRPGMIVNLLSRQCSSFSLSEASLLVSHCRADKARRLEAAEVSPCAINTGI